MTDAPQNQGLYDKSYEHDSCGIGFVANIKGKKTNEIVKRGLEVLERMEHRGAESADNKTGDGAGITIQIPHAFYSAEIRGLPKPGGYGTGLVFLPRDKNEAVQCVKEFTRIVEAEGMRILAWRSIEVNSSVLGEISRSSEPVINQVVLAPVEKTTERDTLERKLFIIRKIAEKTMRNSALSQRHMFYLPSLSTKTIVYKGMLMPAQVREYFKDLQDERVTSAIALVHSRFSTNTFPSWELAQPFRIVAHNGEINTVKGNRFWMQARESAFSSELFGEEIAKILPVIEPDKSDSASFDNALEMLVMCGRSLPHALMMLIPESWNDKNPIPEDLKLFYEYHATFMEPWDGPASMVFCDGRYVGGTLDRNGLRPSRYVITKNNIIVMGSEVGVQSFPPEQIIYKGRLMPGKLLLVDTEEGRIIPDEEIKNTICHQKPYRQWVTENRINLSDLPQPDKREIEFTKLELQVLHHLYGYSREDVDDIITPMAEYGQEPTGSMGTDTSLAVFSEKPQRLYNYFKQIFAQVTNPAIDSIREELVMTLTSFLGSEKNLLAETPGHCRMIKCTGPILSDIDIAKIERLDSDSFRIAMFDMLFPADGGDGALGKSLDELCGKIEARIDEGQSIIVLTDRKADEHRVPMPALLACGSVHHHLIRTKKRTRIALIVETAEAREIMHFALLFGYGANAVHPYGAYATIKHLSRRGKIKEKEDKCIENYRKALEKGLLKILSKMGTSTLRSYRGAQIFEAVGIGKDVVDRCFTGTSSRIGGIGFREVAREALLAHGKAYNERSELLVSQGVYSYRKEGEKHAWNPASIYTLQWATRTGDYEKYRDFARLVNEENRRPHVIRGLFDFRKTEPVPLDEVETEEAIMKRLTTGAMSFGSISKEAHEAIAAAMNTIGGRSNSGEGGEDPERFIKRKDGTWTRSAIKQVASGRFGVTSSYLANADELQIKIAQGAKPGEGGQLPGFKVDKIIARTRNSTPGVTLISPPPHHDIYSIEDLKQLIFDLKNANPAARISVKLVSETGVGTVAAGVAKAHADNILISGYDGGTGASPISSIKHAGLPWELGLSETHQTLVLNNLRSRVRIQTDGQLKTGRDIVLAGILGAEEFGFGTATLIVLGCIMMRKCHLNTCPVGVATQDPELKKRFRGKPEYLINYFTFLAREAREIMASLGIRTFNELIGRTDLLEARNVDHWKAATVDLSAVLYRPKEADLHPAYCTQNQVHKIDRIIDRMLIEKARPALEGKRDMNFYIDMPIANTDRATGAMLSYEISKHFGDDGLPEDTINCTFRGSAGQSFGAFLTRGVTFRLEGDANDYFGKGLSGGKLVVVPPQESTFKSEENIIIGNTVLYGATGGEAYIRGIAGERFCVRNSGALAVIEGTGDHCAEYMTGGRIVVLGDVGRNFAAGMSGGIAFVLNNNGNFDYFCNKGMVELAPVRDYDDQDFIIEMLRKHFKYTGSTVAMTILNNWFQFLPKFVKVLPFEYKRALQEVMIEQIDKKLQMIREEEQLGVIY